MLQNKETLTKITTLKQTFNYDAVVIHFKNGTNFQLILSGELTDIITHLTSPADSHRIPEGYNVVDTFSGCRIIYRVDEISYIEFKPDIENNSSLVYNFD